MAAYVGKDGKVGIGAEDVAYIDTWSLTPSVDLAEVTGYGDSAKAYGSALRSATVTFSGTLDRSDTDQADLMDQFEDGTLADVALRLYTLPASYWYGNFRLTGMTINSAVGDKVSVSWNGTLNGALAYTSS
jgi:hypothetical protein